MHKIVLILLVVLVSSLEAQTSEEKTSSTFGIGISLEQSYSFIYDQGVNYLPIGLGNIYFPINISKNFRIEPDIGIFSYDYDSDDNQKNTNQFRFGVGFHYVKDYGSIKILFGARVGSIFDFVTYENKYRKNTEKYKTTVLILFGGPSIGGEYYFANRFSLGAEAQLNYISLGEYEDDGDKVDATRTIISTRALILLRFYF